MATTYTATAAGSTAQARANIAETISYGEIDISAAIVQNDVFKMVKIPAGARILDTILSCPDVDSASAAVLDVGDSTTSGRFISSSTVGQAGGIARLAVAAGMGYKYAADTTINVKFTTAPGTSATSGTIKLAVVYTMA